MSNEEINRHNLSIYMPCEYHDYRIYGERDDNLLICRECMMITRRVLKPAGEGA